MLRNLIVTILMIGSSLNCASAQWDSLDWKRPHAVATAASAMYQAKHWKACVSNFSKLVETDTAQGLNWVFLSRAHIELGQFKDAIEAASKIKASEAAFGLGQIELARCYASQGKKDLALSAIEAARKAEVIAIKNTLLRDPRLSSIHEEKRFRDAIKDMETTEPRFAALADAQDKENLARFMKSNTLIFWEDVTNNVFLFKNTIDALLSADGNKRKKLVARLLFAGDVTDKALGIEIFSPWAKSATSWNDEQMAAYTANWKKVNSYSRLVRSHQFAKAIKVAGEINDVAKKLGDLYPQKFSMRARGLVHNAIMNYKQPRSGVTEETEWKESRRWWLAYEKLSAALRDPRSLVRAQEFLIDLEAHWPRGQYDEAINRVYLAIATSCRIEAKERELGMFEDQWRKLNKKHTGSTEGAK